MTPDDIKGVFYRKYREGTSWQHPEKPTVQIDLQATCWQAVIDAMRQEVELEKICQAAGDVVDPDEECVVKTVDLRAAPNRCYESMTRMQWGEWTVRVWRTCPQLEFGPDMEVMLSASCSMRGIGAPTREQVCEVLDSVGGIAAYEVLDKDGHGAVVYPDWK